MRLGIISDAHHYIDESGNLCTLVPLVRQFEQWAELFDHVIVCAPLLEGPPPNSHGAYRAKNVTLLAIKNAGGNTVRAKLHLLLGLAGWWSAVKKLFGQVDAVHIRCPNNISIIGLIALIRSKVYRQALYTGNWNGYAGEPATYRMQRWFLLNHFRGPVALYGDWQGRPSNFVPTFSPSFADSDWAMEESSVQEKARYVSSGKFMQGPLQLISVGALNKNKNQQLAIAAVKKLIDMKLSVKLCIAGEGEQRSMLEKIIVSLGLQEHVTLLGYVSHEQLRVFFRASHFVVQPSLTEGFSKGPVEGMLHGVIPLLTDSPVNQMVVENGKRGRCFPQGDADSIAHTIAEIAGDPVTMVEMMMSGREYTRTLTFEVWRGHLKEMLETHWRVRLTGKGSTSC